MKKPDDTLDNIDAAAICPELAAQLKAILLFGEVKDMTKKREKPQPKRKGFFDD